VISEVRDEEGGIIGDSEGSLFTFLSGFLAGSSLTKVAAHAISNGNSAVTPNTNRVPFDSINDPE
tara:strand:+ start:666 stop:860 length:195 start_codon:yes stop_codon:yes gene_type:complete